LREKHTLRAFENSMRRKIFGHKGGVNRGMVLNAPRGSSSLVFFFKYFSGDQIKKKEMSRACGASREREMDSGFWWKF
jgi:hypothetical protein